MINYNFRLCRIRKNVPGFRKIVAADGRSMVDRRLTAFVFLEIYVCDDSLHLCYLPHDDP